MAAPFATYPGLPEVLFTDLDGTLTTAGLVEPETFSALGALAAAGLPVVVVTGRPAGWADALARLWPVAAVIAENGAVTFVRRGGQVDYRCALPPEELVAVRTRMRAAVEEVLTAVPGARLSADSRFREVDLAIDWNEEVRLPVADAERIVRMLRGRGFAATRSSVHVNFGPAGVDKLVACRAYVGGGPLDRYLYVGDALNDAPMFAGFTWSVGVANVRDVWDELDHKPRLVTDAAEGRGFEEIARLLLDRLVPR